MLPIFTKELMYYFKNTKELIVISFLFITLILLVPFAFPAEKGVPAGVPAMILWVGLVCAIQQAASHSWQRHAESGEIELFQLLPWIFEATVLGKLLALYAIILMQLIVILPLATLWLRLPVGQWAQVAAGLAAGGLALVALTGMVAGLMTGHRKGGAILGIITLPFSIPVIIFGVVYLNQPELLHANLLFLCSYAIFLLPIASLAVASSLRASN